MDSVLAVVDLVVVLLLLCFISCFIVCGGSIFYYFVSRWLKKQRDVAERRAREFAAEVEQHAREFAADVEQHARDVQQTAQAAAHDTQAAAQDTFQDMQAAAQDTLAAAQDKVRDFALQAVTWFNLWMVPIALLKLAVGILCGVVAVASPAIVVNSTIHLNEDLDYQNVFRFVGVYLGVIILVGFLLCLEHSTQQSYQRLPDTTNSPTVSVTPNSLEFTRCEQCFTRCEQCFTRCEQCCTLGSISFVRLQLFATAARLVGSALLVFSANCATGEVTVRPIDAATQSGLRHLVGALISSFLVLMLCTLMNEASQPTQKSLLEKEKCAQDAKFGFLLLIGFNCLMFSISEIRDLSSATGLPNGAFVWIFLNLMITMSHCVAVLHNFLLIGRRVAALFADDPSIQSTPLEPWNVLVSLLDMVVMFLISLLTSREVHIDEESSGFLFMRGLSAVINLIMPLVFVLRTSHSVRHGHSKFFVVLLFAGLFLLFPWLFLPEQIASQLDLPSALVLAIAIPLCLRFVETFYDVLGGGRPTGITVHDALNRDSRWRNVLPDAQELHAQESDAQELHAQESDAQALHAQELHAQESHAQELHAQESDAQELHAQESDAQELHAAQESDAQELKAHALTKLVFWHAMQPIAYLSIFVMSWSALDSMHKWLGVIVSMREVAYLTAAVYCFCDDDSRLILVIDLAKSLETLQQGKVLGFTKWRFFWLYVAAPDLICYIPLYKHWNSRNGFFAAAGNGFFAAAGILYGLSHVAGAIAFVSSFSLNIPLMRFGFAVVTFAALPVALHFVLTLVLSGLLTAFFEQAREITISQPGELLKLLQDGHMLNVTTLTINCNSWPKTDDDRESGVTDDEWKQVCKHARLKSVHIKGFTANKQVIDFVKRISNIQRALAKDQMPTFYVDDFPIKKQSSYEFLEKLKLEDWNSIAITTHFRIQWIEIPAGTHSVKISNIKLGPVGAKCFGEAIAVSASITECTLLHNQLTVESAKELATVSEEKIISLCGIGANDTSANFSCKGLQPADAVLIAAAVRFRASLTSINLQGNRIGPVGAKFIGEAIAASSSLRTIDISDNQIGPDGIKYIAEGIAANRSLKTVNISWNRIGSKGATFIREAILKNKSLEAINISNNDIEPLWLKQQLNEVLHRVQLTS